MKEKYVYETDCNKLLDKIIWTHKIQCCELERQSNIQKTIKIIRILFYCISTTGVITGLLLSQNIVSIASAIAIFIVAVLDNVLKLFSFEEKIPQLKFHSQMLCNLREELAFNMRKFERGVTTDSQIESIYKEFLSKYQAICAVKVSESNKSVEKASDKLKNRHDEEANLDIVKEALK